MCRSTLCWSTDYVRESCSSLPSRVFVAIHFLDQARIQAQVGGSLNLAALLLTFHIRHSQDSTRPRLHLWWHNSILARGKRGLVGPVSTRSTLLQARKFQVSTSFTAYSSTSSYPIYATSPSLMLERHLALVMLLGICGPCGVGIELHREEIFSLPFYTLLRLPSPLHPHHILLHA